MPVLPEEALAVKAGVEYDAAIDQLLEIFYQVVKANAETLFGYMPEIRWKGMPEPEAVPMDKFWLRPSTKIVKDGQSSLANDEGKRRYEAIGLFYVQLFCPRQLTNTLTFGRALAKLIRNEFRKPSPTGDLWFRNQRIDELAPTTENYPINVVVEFTYNTVL